jgi:excisionase family DNA binding protein
MENVKEPVPQRLLLRIPEVMTMLGLGRTKIYELIGSGDLPVIRVGKAVRIPRDGFREVGRGTTAPG